MSAERTPHEERVPVSALFAMRRREREVEERAGRAERALMASWRRLNTPFVVAWDAAGDRLREERLMGMHPPVRAVTVPELVSSPEAAMEAAAGGEHVVVTDADGRAAVMVSAEEYDRLRVDRRLLMWERTDGPCERRH